MMMGAVWFTTTEKLRDGEGEVVGLDFFSSFYLLHLKLQYSTIFLPPHKTHKLITYV